MPDYHAWTHRPKYLGGTDPLDWGPAVHEIKVFEDIVEVQVGDNAFIWEVPEDLDGAQIVKVAGFVSTPGSGTTQIALRMGAPGGGTDILTEKITIDAGEYNSKDAAVQPVVVEDTLATWGHHLHVDVDAAGSGAMGLGIHVFYVPYATASLAIQGAQGPPGGVTDFTGPWAPGTDYTAGQAVQSGGNTYVSITNHTSATDTEPGVGVDWEDEWMLLVETNRKAAIHCIINGNEYFRIDTGVKGWATVPFDCTIVEATLLADQVGNAEMDIWKDTYGAFPPTDSDTISGGAGLVLAGANKTTDTSLSGWDTSLLEGDVLAFVVTGEITQGIAVMTCALKVARL